MGKRGKAKQPTIDERKKAARVAANQNEDGGGGGKKKKKQKTTAEDAEVAAILTATDLNDTTAPTIAAKGGKGAKKAAIDAAASAAVVKKGEKKSGNAAIAAKKDEERLAIEKKEKLKKKRKERDARRKQKLRQEKQTLLEAAGSSAVYAPALQDGGGGGVVDDDDDEQQQQKKPQLKQRIPEKTTTVAATGEAEKKKKRKRKHQKKPKKAESDVLTAIAYETPPPAKRRRSSAEKEKMEDEEEEEMEEEAMDSDDDDDRIYKNQAAFEAEYKLTKDFLGGGSHGVVWTAVRKRDGVQVAVKVIAKRPHTRRRIMREIDTFQVCKHHPNVVQLLEVFNGDAEFYLVFEKMRGGALHIHRDKMTDDLARTIIKAVAGALQHLHRNGVAHRDVKPENILCTDPDRVSPVKLADLDLASKASLAADAELSSPYGTAEYRAPEVVAVDKPFMGESLKYDKRCDMWSMGVLLYWLLSRGSFPFNPVPSPCFFGRLCRWQADASCDVCRRSLNQHIQQGKFDFPDAQWSGVRADAKDLIRRLLQPNPEDRLSAAQVLRHPWIRNDAAATASATSASHFRGAAPTAGRLSDSNNKADVQQQQGTVKKGGGGKRHH